MILRNDDVIGENILNIFTDASIERFNDSYIGSAGSITVLNEEIIDQDIQILYPATNNLSEIYSLKLGIMQALKHRNPNIERINIFSDSKISVFGLREWIFKWVCDNKDGTLYSSSGTPVANQTYFLEIINLIMTNQLYVNIYHQRGHKNSNKYQDIVEFKKSFRDSNGIDIQENLIYNLIMYNDYIDRTTRNELSKINKQELNQILSPISYGYRYFNFEEYKKYLGLK